MARFARKAQPDTVVGILNGIDSTEQPALSPRKRGRPSQGRRNSTDEDGNPTKRRRTTDKPVSLQTKTSPVIASRLRRARAFEGHVRSSGAAGLSRTDVYDPPTSPYNTRNNEKAMKRMAATKLVVDLRHPAFGVVEGAEEGEEDATNPLTRSPALGTRSRDKTRKAVERNGDRESAGSRDVRPIKRNQRPQRALGKSAKHDPQILSDVRSLPLDDSPRVRPAPPAQKRQDQPVPTDTGPSDAKASDDDPDQGTEEGSPHPSSPRDEQLRPAEDEATATQPSETDKLLCESHLLDSAKILYNCAEQWNTLLKTARKNRESENEPRTERAEDIAVLIKRAKQECLVIKNTGGLDDENKKVKLRDTLHELEGLFEGHSITKDEKLDCSLIEDIYLRVIPEMVLLLETVLVTWHVEGGITVTGLETLGLVVDLTVRLCVLAQDWTPRPTLPNPIKGTRNSIKPPLMTLKKIYAEALRDATRRERNRSRPDWLAALKERNAKYLAERDRRQASPTRHPTLAERNTIAAQERKRELELREEKRRSQPDWRVVLKEKTAGRQEATQRRREHGGGNIGYHSREGHGERSQNGTFDVDDLTVFDVNDLEIGDDAPAQGHAERNPSWKGTGVAASQRVTENQPVQSSGRREVSRRSRERTEDIPAPMVREWDVEEDEALLAGLEDFRDADRFIQIDRVYGSGNGILRGRDMDELMQRGRHYKHTMLDYIERERIRTGSTEGWTYLLSIEG